MSERMERSLLLTIFILGVFGFFCYAAYFKMGLVLFFTIALPLMALATFVINFPDKVLLHIRYNIYLIRHRWFVFIEACKIGIPIRGFFHDWFKYLPAEYGRYYKKFGVHPSQSIRKENGYDANADKDFAYGWLHHQHYGKHHYQYWISISQGKMEPLEVPIKYMKEMLADMRGASRSIKGSLPVVDYYAKTKNQMILHENSRKWLEEQIGYAPAEEESACTLL
jgi:hypothetical protein